MKILKFGGTSLGSIENLRKVKDILKNDSDQKIVVCSAMSGVTNHLIFLSENIRLKNTEIVAIELQKLKEKHLQVINHLIANDKKNSAKNKLNQVINEIFELSRLRYTEVIYSKIIVQGEMLVTQILSSYLSSLGLCNVLLKSEDFMCVDNIENPNIEKVAEKLDIVLKNVPKSMMYITQGFVCKNDKNEIANLKRGGSDYSATIIGAAIEAKEIQIWTDIDGVHNNDPRYVEETRSIPYLSYAEASEVAFYGAKVLHPQTVLPVMNKEIPILIKNTLNSAALGTIISNKVSSTGVKAISVKDNISTMKVKSNMGSTTYSILKKVFDVFDRYQISIDMMTISERTIVFATENSGHLVNIQKEIETYAEVVIEPCNSIICMVGEGIIEDRNTHKFFTILKHVSIKMISFGGSNNNISILVDTKDKISSLQFLHNQIFHKHRTVDLSTFGKEQKVFQIAK